jgi:hypothetical protein
MPNLKTRRTLNEKGEFIAELPGVLLVLFILLMVPMIQLASVTYRAYLVRTAALEAVHRAGRAQSFIADLPGLPGDPPNPSAQTIFAKYIRASIDNKVLANGQLQTPTPALCCLAQPIMGGAPTVFTAPLPPAMIEVSKYEYFFELRGSALVAPLLPFTSNLFPVIPGVTGPMDISVSCRQRVENPAGLAY